RPPAAPAARREPSRGAGGESQDPGRIALQRENGARRTPTLRPPAAPAARREPAQGVRGKSKNPGRIALQRETDTAGTTGQGASTSLHPGPRRAIRYNPPMSQRFYI